MGQSLLTLARAMGAVDTSDIIAYFKLYHYRKVGLVAS